MPLTYHLQTINVAIHKTLSGKEGKFAWLHRENYCACKHRETNSWRKLFIRQKAFYETEGQTTKKMVANTNIDLPAHPFHP